jgi:hypothetical protein
VSQDRTTQHPNQYNNVVEESKDYAAIASGADNLITAGSLYACIAGGTNNAIVDADYAALGGGLKNVIISAWGSIAGGYKNHVSGRFSAIIGGSRNSATGRHSVALGFGSITNGQQNLVMGFRANDDTTNNKGVLCELGSENDYTIKLCGDQILWNEFDVYDVLSTIATPSTKNEYRQLESPESGIEESMIRLKTLQSKLDERRGQFKQQMKIQSIKLEEQLQVLGDF